jgi:hypothetical protein
VGRDFELFAFAGHDVDSAAGQANAKAADDVAENRADHGSSAGADGCGEGVTFVVVLLLDHATFFDLSVFARLSVGFVATRLLNIKDAHLYRDNAAVDFERAEGEIHIGFAANEGESAGGGDGADNTIDAGAGRNEELVTEVNGLGDNGDERIAFARSRGTDGIQQGEANLGALHDLAGLSERSGGCYEQQSDYENCGHQLLHFDFLLPHRDAAGPLS